MIESLALALLLTASPAEPAAATPIAAPAVASDMTPEQRKKRAARVAAAKKQKSNEARKAAAAKKAGKPWVTASGMKLAKAKRGALKTKKGPNVKQTKPGKSHVRKDVETPPKKNN